MAPRDKQTPKVYTLTRQEAAQSMGISLSTFQRHIQPDLRLVRRGRRVLIPDSELARWVKDNTEDQY
jgi:excisionase family DNA binding protein